LGHNSDNSNIMKQDTFHCGKEISSHTSISLVIPSEPSYQMIFSSFSLDYGMLIDESELWFIDGSEFIDSSELIIAD